MLCLHSLPRLLAVLTACMCLACLHAGEEGQLLSDLHKANPDPKAWQAALLATATDEKQSPSLRALAIHTLNEWTAETGDWTQSRAAFAQLLAKPNQPEELQYFLAQGLCRADRRPGQSFTQMAAALEKQAVQDGPSKGALLHFAVQVRLDCKAMLTPGVFALPAFPIPPLTPALDAAAVQVEADKQLPIAMTADARQKIAVKQWPEARARFLSMMQQYPTAEAASFDGILKTFAQEQKAPKLTDPIATDAFTAYFAEQQCPKTTRAAAAMYLCNLYFDGNDYARALEALATVKKDFPDSKKQPEADLLTGLCYSRLDQHDKSMPIFAQLADGKDIAPAIAQKARFFIGWTHLLKQENNAARDAFQQLVKEAPDSDLGKKAQDMLNRLPAAEKKPE